MTFHNYYMIDRLRNGISFIRVGWCIVVMMFLMPTMQAQRFLQVEKRNVKVSYRIATGDFVSFQLRQHPQWIHSQLMELDEARGIVYFEHITTHVDSIIAIKKGRPIVSPALGSSLIKSGLAALGTSVLATLFYKPDNGVPFIIGSGGVVLSGGILKLLAKKHKVYVIDEKYGIRIIDLTFYI